MSTTTPADTAALDQTDALPLPRFGYHHATRSSDAPAINVKDSCGWDTPEARKLAAEVGEGVTEQCYEEARAAFWDLARDQAAEAGYGEVYSAGRMGGWLTVEGVGFYADLPDGGDRDGWQTITLAEVLPYAVKYVDAAHGFVITQYGAEMPGEVYGDRQTAEEAAALLNDGDDDAERMADLIDQRDAFLRFARLIRAEQERAEAFYLELLQEAHAELNAKRDAQAEYAATIATD